MIKKVIKTFILTFLFSTNIMGQFKDKDSCKKILFIGNSLTYYNNMTKILTDMLSETQGCYVIEQVTFPGISLRWHLEKIVVQSEDENIILREKFNHEISESERKIKEQNWDFIIIQDGTVRFLIPEYRELVIGIAIKRIIQMVKNPNCIFILFTTWPSEEDYPKKYCYDGKAIDKSLIGNQYCSPTMYNLKEEVYYINKAFNLVSEKYNIIKSDNLNVFYSLIKNYPEINLLDDPYSPFKIWSLRKCMCLL